MKLKTLTTLLLTLSLIFIIAGCGGDATQSASTEADTSAPAIPAGQPITVDNADQIEQLAMLGRGLPRDVAYSPDGATLAVASSVGIWLYEADDLDAVPRFLDGHTDFVYSVAWSPDGTALASASGDRTVRLWDAATGEQTAVLEGHTWTVTSVAWSPDGTALASASLDGTVRLWGIPDTE